MYKDTIKESEALILQVMRTCFFGSKYSSDDY